DVGGGEVDCAVDGGLPEGALAAVAVRDSGLQHVLVGAQVHDGELRGRGRIARHDVVAERFAVGAFPNGGAEHLGLVDRFTEIRDRAVGAWSVGFDGGLGADVTGATRGTRVAGSRANRAGGNGDS